MSPDLSGARAKLSRAQHHLDALEAEVSQFLQMNPYTVVEEVKYDARDLLGAAAIAHIFRVHVHRERPEWGLLIGDCVHNLRSSLDHLVWQLAGGRGNTKTEFPIARDSKWYESNAPKKFPHVGPDARKIIKSFQPCYRRPNDPEGDPLWVLNDLANIDKHRLLHTTAVAYIPHYGGLPPDKPSDVILGVQFPMGRRPFHDGAEIARYNITRESGEPPPDMKVEVEFAFDITFDPKGPARGAPLLPGIQGLRNAVFDVLEQF